MWNQARAIVWAQSRTVRNYFPRSNIAGTVFSGLIMTGLYGVFVFLGVVAPLLLANPDDIEFARRVPFPSASCSRSKSFCASLPAWRCSFC